MNINPVDESKTRSEDALLNNAHPEGLAAVSAQVLRYFREFIETDFKRQQAPRRRIQLKTASGFRSGIDLRKYPAFFQDAWDLMSKPAQEMVLPVKRRKYRAEMSPVLKNMVAQYVEGLDEAAFAVIRDDVVSDMLSRRQAFATDPDGFVEEAKLQLALRTAGGVVQPLLSMLESAFKENAYSAQESIFEVQAELTELLCESVAVHLGAALNTILLEGKTEALHAVLCEFFCALALRDRIVDFFEAYAAADVLQELRDIHDYMRSDDALTIYLYLGALRFGANDYPLFFMPVQLRQLTTDAGYDLVVEPRLYVNKQAIEFISAQMHSAPPLQVSQSNPSSATTTTTKSTASSAPLQAVKTSIVNERIIHLADPGSAATVGAASRTAATEVQRIMRELGRSFDVAERVDFSSNRSQSAKSTVLRLSNAAHLVVFDRNDESLVSDYEALLSSIDGDHQAANVMFTDLVSSMLFDEPESVSDAVRAEWAGMTASARLLVPSPIPLNEEQARIDVARRKGTKFIAVEGPPGTGKSHAIAALSFNAIMDGLSVLIVSDKNEALEVVQDKLTQALQSVRHGDDFPNPILRLGKDGTYRTLISASSRVKIENHHRAQTANMQSLEGELADHTKDLSERMEQTISSLSSLKMADIALFHQIESKLRKNVGLDENADRFVTALDSLCTTAQVQPVLTALARMGEDERRAVRSAFAGCTSFGQLVMSLQVAAVCNTVSPNITTSHLEAMGHFGALKTAQGRALATFAAKITSLKMPVLGFLFRGNALSAIESEMALALPCPNPVGLSRQVPALRSVVSVLAYIERAAKAIGLAEEHTDLVYGALQSTHKEADRARARMGAGEAVQLTQALFHVCKDTPSLLVFDHLVDVPVVNFVFDTVQFMEINVRLRHLFESVPRVDFVKEKTQLEAMQTARLAHRLDSRFLEFVEKHRATAQALGGVVKSRSQFPVAQFKTLSHAFPCVIAGIRELAEFVPLKTEVFDLCIMDEGSQVSVAQAMPAMLRSRQVIVFGDRKQFSNTKSHNASNATNSGYLSELQDNFRRDVSSAVDKLERLQRFDVKRSVLEFIELVAGHTEMLRKHFRGYPELISFSSKNFYDGALQAIKIRAKPIDEVLRFEVVEPHKEEANGREGESSDARRNTSVAEGMRIIEILEEIVEGGSMPHQQVRRPSVGIITPFAEQAAYLSSLISRHPKGERMDGELKIKVMTCDSCQGEERDIIIYSMVATRERDVLNFVFPVELKTNEDENDTLKAQRLNVAFSRAKEMMIFVLSKPPEEFSGSLGRALLHYRHILDDRSMATDDQVDKSSPMERKVLHWLKNTRFMQQNAGSLELIAQFPVGDYLRQLDPTYHHPAYKVDFLLRHHGKKTTNLIIEYDGFEHHFVDRERVTAANFEWYQKPQDVERQFILESYGYRFLRINRFNVGRDPVATLDDRLSELISLRDLQDPAEGGHATPSVKRMLEQAQALDSKEAKTCSRCKEVKDKASFFDPRLANCQGAYGRVCKTCKVGR